MVIVRSWCFGEHEMSTMLVHFSEDNILYPALLILETFLPSVGTESLVTTEEKTLYKYIKYLTYSLVLLNADDF